MERISNTLQWNFIDDNRNTKSFYYDVARNPVFLYPLLFFCILAFLPSITNTKRQFEDFHMDKYFGSEGVMRTGRWGMYLWAKILGKPGNDVLNKAIGLAFIILSAVLISYIFYLLTRNKQGVIKYTIASTLFATYPLINEIWSYNVANSLVCINYFLSTLTVLVFIQWNTSVTKKIAVASVPATFLASSYEAGVFVYITLVCGILLILMVYKKISIRQYFLYGIVFAIPLVIGIAVGVTIGKTIAAVTNTTYLRFGNTGLHWKDSGALKTWLFGNIDRYVLRALVYLPITIFVISAITFLIVLVYWIIKNGSVFIIPGIILLLSLFLLSLYQGSFLPYRTAQNITVFITLVFFIIIELSENWTKQARTGVITLAIALCFLQSRYLLNINLLDYQNAHNDEDLVRQIGYELTTDYYGKPVLFTGHLYDGENLYSKSFQKQITVDTKSINGHLYDICLKGTTGESAQGKKYHDTNLWSVLFLAVYEEQSMEQFFSYCGYSIDVLPYGSVINDDLEAKLLIESGKLHTLEFFDMGDYVIVNL